MSAARIANAYMSAFTTTISAMRTPSEKLAEARENYARGLLTLDAFEIVAEQLIRQGA